MLTHIPRNFSPLSKSNSKRDRAIQTKRELVFYLLPWRHVARVISGSAATRRQTTLDQTYALQRDHTNRSVITEREGDRRDQDQADQPSGKQQTRTLAPSRALSKPICSCICICISPLCVCVCIFWLLPAAEGQKRFSLGHSM